MQPDRRTDPEPEGVPERPGRQAAGQVQPGHRLQPPVQVGEQLRAALDGVSCHRRVNPPDGPVERSLVERCHLPPLQHLHEGHGGWCRHLYELQAAVPGDLIEPRPS